MKLINVVLFFVSAQLAFSFAPSSLKDATFEVVGDYTYLHLLHPDYFDAALYGTKSKYSIKFKKDNQAVLFEEGLNTATYEYYYKKNSDTSASLTIETTYSTTILVNLTFSSDSSGTGSYTETHISNEVWSRSNLSFTFTQLLDLNNPNNWYLFGGYWHQPSTNTYVTPSKFGNGAGYIKEGERKIINDTTIPADHLRWFKFANKYYWQQANNIFITISDFTQGNFDNVFKLSNEEIDQIVAEDTSWYKFGREYYNPKMNITVLDTDVDNSEYADEIKTYFSNEPRSPYYGYKSQKLDQEVIADPSYTPIQNNAGFFLSDGWIYSPKHGWIFTNSTIYPYFYLNKTNSWYCYKMEEGSSMVYDYKLNNWIFDF